ncbi:hypothetical protein TNCV_4642491 [Trichonephila clavipes]|nr:hypothetical protein TNCV_4642491 [Trichonephila clavipes]
MKFPDMESWPLKGKLQATKIQELPIGTFDVEKKGSSVLAYQRKSPNLPPLEVHVRKLDLANGLRRNKFGIRIDIFYSQLHTYVAPDIVAALSTLRICSNIVGFHIVPQFTKRCSIDRNRFDQKVSRFYSYPQQAEKNSRLFVGVTFLLLHAYSTAGVVKIPLSGKFGENDHKLPQ